MYTLVVLHKLEDSFAYYQIPGGKQIVSINTRPYPHEICLDLSGQKIYIAEMGVRGIESEGPGGHTISVYDIKAKEQISTIDTGEYDRPHGIVTHGNRLYVTSESTKNLLIYNLDNNSLITTVFLGQECSHMVNISPDGRTAYTANIWSDSITAVDTDTYQVLHHISVPERPEGMVFSPEGELIYCVCREAGCVAVIDRKPARMSGRILTGNGPVRIAGSPDGQTLYIPLFHSAAVQFADTRTLEIIHTISVGPHPAGICTSPDNKLIFISCEEENMVYIIDSGTCEVIEKVRTGAGPDAMVCLFSNETE